jgi:hypothetical protein
VLTVSLGSKLGKEMTMATGPPITLFLLVVLGCPSPGPRDAAVTEGTPASPAAGRWTVNPDLGLSGIVTGLELSTTGDTLEGQAYLSGRVVPVRGSVRGDSILLASAPLPNLRIRGRLSGDSVLHAVIADSAGAHLVTTRFVRHR